MDRVDILQFTDVFCVWAYVAQARIDELCAHFDKQVRIEPHFIPVFGDVQGKMAREWDQRGGLTAYGKHVHAIAKRFDLESVDPDCWTRASPRSSMGCHLFLHAIGQLEVSEECEDGSLERGAHLLRERFFCQGVDVSKPEELDRVAADLGIDPKLPRAKVTSGEAFAALSRDFELIREHSVSMSPTLIFNAGRQRLQGNIGYRVIEANVRELLAHPAGGHAWC